MILVILIILANTGVSLLGFRAFREGNGSISRDIRVFTEYYNIFFSGVIFIISTLLRIRNPVFMISYHSQTTG